MKSDLLSRAYASSPLLLFVATLGWGSNTIASRLAVGEVSPMLLIFFRWGIVVVILVSFYWREMIAEWPVIKPRLKWLLIMGGCGLSLFNAFFYIAAHSTTAVNLGIIQSTMPGMILLGSFMLFGDRINKLQFSGLLLTLLGVVVIVTQGSVEKLMQLTFNNGDLLMIFACSFYAMYTVGLKSRPKIAGMVMLAYFSVAAFLMTIPLMIAESFTYGTVIPGARVMYGILTGMGFIGGGAILKSNGKVGGTATAAAIWNTGAIGVSVAYGRYEIALVLSFINFVVFQLANPIKKISGANRNQE